MPFYQSILLLFCLILPGLASAEVSPEVAALQTGWAKANYQLQGEAKEQAFLELIKQAETLTGEQPQSAAAWIWQGIIQSTFAGVAGPFDAMDYAKAAKASLEKAMSIDDKALDGSAYTSLGTLYFKVPGWPIGFGDDEKAAELLKTALALNPDGIDSNYFYADYLADQGDYQQARVYLQKAEAAAPRANRQDADAGRHQDIKTLLEKVEKELE